MYENGTKVAAESLPHRCTNGEEAAQVRVAELGPTVPVRVACTCPVERSLPLRLVADTLAHLRLHLRGKLAASTPVLTYRCRHCKEVVTITAGDLFLADAEQLQIPLRR